MRESVKAMDVRQKGREERKLEIEIESERERRKETELQKEQID